MSINTPKRLSTVKNLPQKYPDANFTENSIRWLIFNAKENGFSICIKKAGKKKILIDLDEFENWMDMQALKGAEDFQ